MAMRHTYETKTGHETGMVTPLRMIRQKCLECSSWQPSEVRECPMTDCALYVFRFGKSGMTRDLTDEQREGIKNRLQEGKCRAEQSIT